MSMTANHALNQNLFKEIWGWAQALPAEKLRGISPNLVGDHFCNRVWDALEVQVWGCGLTTIEEETMVTDLEATVRDEVFHLIPDMVEFLANQYPG